MAEKVGSQRIIREKGYLYYLGKDGFLWRIPTQLNPTGTRARVGHEKITRQDGYIYFIDKEGYISKAKMREEPESTIRLACRPGPYDVGVGEYTSVPLAAEKGERVKGRLFELDGQDFDWAIVDERNSVRVHEGEDYSFEREGDHVHADTVSWKVPKPGPWFLILEIPYRQNPRSVKVELRRESA